MPSKSQLLLLVFGFCLNAAFSADVDCSKRPPFVNPKTCCPMPEFVTAELKQKCLQFDVTPSPPTDSGSMESKRRHHHPHPPPCLFSCIFNETGIYQNRNLDQGKLTSYLEVVYKDSSDLQTTATQAFTTCATKVAEFEANLPSTRPAPPPGLPICPHDAGHLMGCVFRNLMKNCPDSIRNDSQECTEVREFFTKCKPPRGGPPPPGEDN
ncbi:general odorant-binding protein 67 [Drosophila ficusphila]|uniref:general odorant-binding protein 67 n=1 Tax=Drosophila ficusphila TaxID=30025 RepID=UPI0007E7BD37|nr:general odorant-binding protein 67 [Drosophila ficusphila]